MDVRMSLMPQIAARRLQTLGRVENPQAPRQAMTVTARKPASYFSSPPGGDPSARPRLGVYLLTAMAVVVATLTAVALTVIVQVALGMLPRPWTMFVTQSLTAHKMDVKGVRRLARIVLAKIKKEYEKSTWQTQLGKVDVLKHIDGLRWRMPDERDYESDASDTPLPKHRGENRTYLRRLASLRLVSHWASNDPSGFDSGYGEKPLPSGLRYPPERPVVRYEYERNTLWVTPAALSRPFYYSGAEPHINLAALGALLAYEMWSALIRHTPPPRPPGSVSSFQDEVSCYVAAYRALTNDTTPDTFVGPELYSRIKALRTVLDASREFFSKDRRSTGRWPDVGEMQLFFVRYCSLSCVRNTAGVARASQCDIPIASTPAFTRLFDCRPTDPLANLPANCNDAS